MTSTGLFIGLFFGIIVIFFQQKFGFVPIAPNMPYPVKLEFMNVVIVLVTILFLGGWLSPVDIYPFNIIPGVFWMIFKILLLILIIPFA